jgi:predicted O-methyltransferase YrrM
MGKAMKGRDMNKDLERLNPYNWNIFDINNQKVEDPLSSQRHECEQLRKQILNLNGLHQSTLPNKNWFESCIVPVELSFFLTINNIKDLSCILEIGLNTGGTHFLFKQLSQLVISIDNSWEKVVCTTAILNLFNQSKGSQIIYGDSTDSSTIRKTFSFTDKIDLLLIDGDHSEDKAYKDFSSYYHKVKAGGQIVFDDVFSEKAIIPVLNRIEQSYRLPINIIYSQNHVQDSGHMQGLAFVIKPN